MKKTLTVCILLAALAGLALAGSLPTVTSQGSAHKAATVVAPKPAEEAQVANPTDQYATAKIRYWELYDKVLSGTSSHAEDIEMSDLCQAYGLEYPTIPPEEPRAGIPGSLDQGSSDTVSNCASATVIPGVPFNDTGFLDGDNDCSVISASPYNEVFYTFTPTTTAMYQFRLRIDSTTAPAIRIVSGGCCLGAVNVAFSSSSVATDCPRPDSAGNELTTRVTYTRALLTAGVQYWIHVGLSSTTLLTHRGYFLYVWSVPCPTPEVTTNHTCATAQSVLIGDSLLGNNTVNNPDWFTFTVPGPNSDSVRIFVGAREWGHCMSGYYPVNSSNFTDGRFTLYRGCGGLPDSIGNDDDTGCSFDAKKDFCLAPGTYYVKAWNYVRSGTAIDTSYIFKTTDLGICGQTMGRCCYLDPCNPTCWDRTQAQCTALGGTWTAGLSCTTSPCVVPPVGDMCCSAVPLAVPSSTQTTNVGMTTDATGVCTSSQPYYGIWYTVVGNDNLITATTCNAYGTQVDTRLQVFTGTCGALVCLGGNDDDNLCTQGTVTPTYHSTFSWCSNVGVTYYIHVGSYSTTTGTFQLDILNGANCHIVCADYAPCGAPAETEPNDSCYWAANFTPLVCGAPGTTAFYYGTICPFTDVDYYYLPGMSLGQILMVKLYDGADCSVYPATAACMKGATGVGGVCAPATGTATLSYILGTQCTPFTGGYMAVTQTLGIADKYKIAVTCSTAVLPVCPSVQMPKQFCAGPCVGPIVDVSTVEYPITVSLNETIDDLNIRLDATHTYVGDVDIVLITPQGDSLALTRNHGTGGDNWQVTVFDDQATTTMAAGVAPYNGSFIPDQPLALVNGRQTAGTWILRLRDEVSGDFGYVNCWCLEFTSHLCTADPSVTIVPNDLNFPSPQNVNVCAHLVAGTLTNVVVPVYNGSNLPTVIVSGGCPSEPNCVPLSAWDMSAWTYQATPPEFHATITAAAGATGCCVNMHLDYVLPVEFGNLSATAGDNAVKLTWNTRSETNTDRFDVLRDGITVARVTATNTPSGNTYYWTDASAMNGTTYSYALVAVSLSGVRQTLATVSAVPSFNAAIITEYALHQNFPNPFNPTTSIAVDLVETGFVSLKVYNLMGQEVASLLTARMDAGRHIVNFNAANLSSGIYLYRLNVNGFVAEKKMLLMK